MGVRATPAIMKRTGLFIVAVCCSVLSACGGGSGGDSGTISANFTPESKSQAVGPAGGTFTHTLTNGTVFQLDVPAGALTSETTLTLTTQEPVQGQLFNLLLEPAGLVLKNGAYVTLTITLPSGQTLPSTGGLVYDGFLIP